MCNYPRALSHLIESKKELGGQCLSPQTPRHLYEAFMTA